MGFRDRAEIRKKKNSGGSTNTASQTCAQKQTGGRSGRGVRGREGKRSLGRHGTAKRRYSRHRRYLSKQLWLRNAVDKQERKYGRSVQGDDIRGKETKTKKNTTRRTLWVCVCVCVCTRVKSALKRDEWSEVRPDKEEEKSHGFSTARTHEGPQEKQRRESERDVMREDAKRRGRARR